MDGYKQAKKVPLKSPQVRALQTVLSAAKQLGEEAGRAACKADVIEMLEGRASSLYNNKQTIRSFETRACALAVERIDEVRSI